MKAQDLTLRGINKGQTIEIEEGTILITDKKSGYGSGNHTVASGSIKYTNGNTATFENATIWGIKALFGIKCGGSKKTQERKLYEALSTLRNNLHSELLEILDEDDEQEYSAITDGAEDDEEEEELTSTELLLLLARCTQYARRIMWKKEAEAEAEAEAEKQRKATAAALLKGGLTAEQLAQIQAILEAK